MKTAQRPHGDGTFTFVITYLGTDRFLHSYKLRARDSAHARARGTELVLASAESPDQWLIVKPAQAWVNFHGLALW